MNTGTILVYAFKNLSEYIFCGNNLYFYGFFYNISIWGNCSSNNPVNAGFLKNNFLCYLVLFSCIISKVSPFLMESKIEDLMFMLFYANIKVLVLVSNHGVLHYLLKNDDYNEAKAKRYIVSYTAKIRSARGIFMLCMKSPWIC